MPEQLGEPMPRHPVVPSRRRDNPSASQSPCGAICTVVVADADEDARRLTRQMLKQVGFRVVAEAGTATSAVSTVLENRPDLCVLEVDLPGGGARATSEILVANPETTVMIYTDSTTDDHLFGALRAGASGYVLKADSADQLATSLRGVLEGEASIPRQLMRRVLSDYAARAYRRAGGWDRLTEREREVAELMRHGLTTNEIADRLFIAPVTVRTHIASTRRKLDAADRAALIKLVDGA